MKDRTAVWFAGIATWLAVILVAQALLGACGVSCSGQAHRGSSRGLPSTDASDLVAAAVPDAGVDSFPPPTETGRSAEHPQGVVVTSIAAGGGQACAITGAGAWCWGRNKGGELGRSGPSTATPGLVPLPETPVAIAAGGGGGDSDSGHTCALTVSGKLYCWGFNLDGQLGDGTRTNRPDPQLVAGLDQVASVGAGSNHTCARKKDGTVWCWGRGRAAALGNGKLDDQLSPVQVTGLTDAQALAVGQDHACVRRPDGSVLCWGANHFGELGSGDRVAGLVPTVVKGLLATSVTAGTMVSCAVSLDRTVMCWGTNEYGQVGDGSGDRGVMALTPTQVKGLSDIETVVAGGVSVCALPKAGRLSCWGGNYTGQVPGSDQEMTLAPFTINSVTGVTAVALGAGFSLALLADGSLWGWGTGVAVQPDGSQTGAIAQPHRIVGLSN